MLKHVKVACSLCGSHDVSGWYNEHIMRYMIRCNNCGMHKGVTNIKVEEETDD